MSIASVANKKKCPEDQIADNKRYQKEKIEIYEGKHLLPEEAKMIHL